jgi:hypothetical protein
MRLVSDLQVAAAARRGAAAANNNLKSSVSDVVDIVDIVDSSQQRRAAANVGPGNLERSIFLVSMGQHLRHQGLL